MWILVSKVGILVGITASVSTHYLVKMFKLYIYINLLFYDFMEDTRSLVC